MANTLYHSTDEAGKKLMTSGNIYYALNDGKTIKVETEFGIETFVKGDSPADILLVHGSYHYQFGKNVLFPMNIDEMV